MSAMQHDWQFMVYIDSGSVDASTSMRSELCIEARWQVHRGSVLGQEKSPSCTLGRLPKLLSSSGIPDIVVSTVRAFYHEHFVPLCCVGSSMA